jgi:tetratricopeptide (TPR) repeat protein
MPSLPDNTVEHLLARAGHLKSEGQYEEALVLLEQIISRNPQHVVALEEVADNELSLGHYDRADTAAQRVLGIDPKSFAAHYVRGFVASHREEWEVSIESLKVANKLEQNHPEILRCLGWSLFSVGRTLEGVVTLERALNLDEENPLILCDLGVVYLKLKDFGKSKALLERAIDIDPKNERAEECLEMVRRIERHAVAEER